MIIVTVSATVCRPAPVDAIHFVEREAAAYDEKAVEEHKKSKEVAKTPCGCPGSQARAIRREADADRSAELQTAGEIRSELTQWPVQIKLAPVRAPYFDGAKLLNRSGLQRIRLWRFPP